MASRIAKLRKAVAIAEAEKLTDMHSKCTLQHAESVGRNKGEAALRLMKEDLFIKERTYIFSLEENPEQHPLLCLPSITAEWCVDLSNQNLILKVPVFGSLAAESNSKFKYDAYVRHIYSHDAIEEIKLKLKIDENNWGIARDYARELFFKGGSVIPPDQTFITRINKETIVKRFIFRAIQRIAESMHIEHNQKMNVVAVMLAAWMQPK